MKPNSTIDNVGFHASTQPTFYSLLVPRQNLETRKLYNFLNMNKDDLVAEAVDNFISQNFACAESVLLAYCQVAGIETSCVPKIATGFSGGIGGSGSMCGALTGGVMALGLAYGRTRPDDFAAKETTKQKVQQLCHGFREEFGSFDCLELSGCLLCTPEGHEKFKSQYIKREKCCHYVEKAAELLAALIE